MNKKTPYTLNTPMMSYCERWGMVTGCKDCPYRTEKCEPLTESEVTDE